VVYAGPKNNRIRYIHPTHFLLIETAMESISELRNIDPFQYNCAMDFVTYLHAAHGCATEVETALTRSGDEVKILSKEYQEVSEALIEPKDRARLFSTAQIFQGAFQCPNVKRKARPRGDQIMMKNKAEFYSVLEKLERQLKSFHKDIKCSGSTCGCHEIQKYLANKVICAARSVSHLLPGFKKHLGPSNPVFLSGPYRQNHRCFQVLSIPNN
jgi:hypothetical protein